MINSKAIVKRILREIEEEYPEDQQDLIVIFRGYETTSSYYSNMEIEGIIKLLKSQIKWLEAHKQVQ